MAGPVNVRGYTRADGTRVSAHTRALPTRAVGIGISGGLGIAAIAAIVLLTGGGANSSPEASPGRSGTSTPSTAAGAPPKTTPATAHNPTGLPVRSVPGPDGPVLGTIPDGATVQVHCYSRGPLATGWGGKSSYWNKISYAGLEGFAADVDLDTRRQVFLVAPRC